jgi:outer membrane protein
MLLLKRLSLSVALACGTASFTQAAEPLGNTLEDFFTAVMNYSPALKAAEARWNMGDARIDYANGQLLPQVNASANTSDNTRQESNQLRQEYSGRNMSIQLSQVLFNWQAYAGRQQAYLQENQFEAEYYATLAEVFTQVADDYLAVLQTEDALASINSELEAITNQVNQIQRMFDLQLTKVTDLYNAQAQQAAVQTQRVTAEADLTIASETLYANTGLAVGGLNRLPQEVRVFPLQGTLDEWLARAAENNKRIEASSLAVQVAQKTVSIRQGAYMPRVSLILQHQTSNLGFQNAPLNRADNNYVGIDVSMPLFAGGSNYALVREAQSQRTMAESERQQVSLDVYNRARTAYFQVKAGESRIEASQVLAESTSTAATAMQRGFELGTETSVNVLNALRDQFRAQRDLQRARYDLIRSTLALEREAGTLTAEDLQQVSNSLNAPPATR